MFTRDLSSWNPTLFTRKTQLIQVNSPFDSDLKTRARACVNLVPSVLSTYRNISREHSRLNLWRPFSVYQTTVYRLLWIWVLFNPKMSYLSAVEMMNMRHNRQNQDALNVSTILAYIFCTLLVEARSFYIPYAECELLKLGLTITEV